MTYPNGPYGGPVPPGFQPAHPPSVAYPYPPPPAYPYPPPPGYPPPTASPSGVPGIIAGVLAAIGGVLTLVRSVPAAIRLAGAMGDPVLWGGPWVIGFAAVVLTIAGGAALLAGAVTLFLRRMIGRWLVVAGCGGVIVASLLSVALVSHVVGYLTVGGRHLLYLVPAVATLVLVSLPATVAWIRAKQVAARPPDHPPYPG